MNKGDIICIIRKKEWMMTEAPPVPIPTSIIEAFGKVIRREPDHYAFLVKLIRLPGRVPSYPVYEKSFGSKFSIKIRRYYSVPEPNCFFLLKAKQAHNYKGWQELLALAKLMYAPLK